MFPFFFQQTSHNAPVAFDRTQKPVDGSRPTQLLKKKERARINIKRERDVSHSVGSFLPKTMSLLTGKSETEIISSICH